MICDTSSIGYEIIPENHSLDGGRNVTSKNSTKICPVTLQANSTKHIHKTHISIGLKPSIEFVTLKTILFKCFNFDSPPVAIVNDC